MKKYNFVLGLMSLLFFIPIPTLIFNTSKSLTESGAINFLAIHLVGAQAQLLLFSLTISGITLLTISLRELGGIFNSHF